MITFVAILLVLLMLAVCWWDATRFTIPNWLVAAVLALYAAYFYFSPTPIDWQMSLGIAGLAFVLGLGLFAGNIMGGGDVKLLTVCCLWAGKEAILPYILVTALIGGALSIFMLAGRPIAAFIWLKMFKRKKLPRLLESGEPIPYGLAIAGGILLLLFQNKLSGIHLVL